MKLGLCYKFGEGTSRDPQLAATWLRKARMFGSERANEAIQSDNEIVEGFSYHFQMTQLN